MYARTTSGNLLTLYILRSIPRTEICASPINRALSYATLGSLSYRVTRPFLITVAWVLKAVCPNKHQQRGGGGGTVVVGEIVVGNAQHNVVGPGESTAAEVVLGTKTFSQRKCNSSAYVYVRV